MGSCLGLGANHWAHRLARRLLTLAMLVALAWLLPAETWGAPLPAKHAAIVVLTIGGLGKILYDTLFYDHYAH